MILSEPIQTDNLTLRTLNESDANEAYLSWLMDPAINQFLEIRFTDGIDRTSLAESIASSNASPDNLLCGIVQRQTGDHIGNIKLGPIVGPHARAAIGFLIGDKSYWGNGYATEAIIALSGYGFTELNLEKITAGCYETNVGSRKALERAGFVHEATLRSDVVSEGKRIASLLFALHR